MLTSPRGRVLRPRGAVLEHLPSSRASADSDPSQPGIQVIVSYLVTLPWHPNPKCEANRFYMINNLSRRRIKRQPWLIGRTPFLTAAQELKSSGERSALLRYAPSATPTTRRISHGPAQKEDVAPSVSNAAKLLSADSMHRSSYRSIKRSLHSAGSVRLAPRPLRWPANCGESHLPRAPRASR